MNAPRVWTGLLSLALCLSLRVHTGDAQPGAGLPLRKPFFDRLRRLDEQFRRFQEMTLTQLQGIAENYNISYNIDDRFQALAEQQQNLSESLAAFQASAGGELSGLKLWTKKLQKKTDRLEMKVSELEVNLEEEESSRRPAAPGERPEEQEERISNVTLELREHAARVDAAEADRDEVRGELEELRGTVRRQEARMAELEEQLRSVLRQNLASPPPAGPGEEDTVESNLAPQDPGPRTLAAGRGHVSPKFSARLQLKHSKGMKAKAGLRVTPEVPQKETEPRSHPHPQEEPLWDQTLPRSQNEPTDVWNSPQPHPKEQPHPYPHPQLEPKEIWEEPQHPLREESEEIWEQLQPRPQEEPMGIWEQSQPRPQEEPMKIWEQSRPRPLEKPMGIWEQSQPRPEEDPTGLWETPDQQEELRDVLDLPLLPLRHKIPQHPHAPKSTTCNVKSALNFPSASTHNYVTFKKGFATGVHELSVCTWLRVGAGAGYVGTVLSYATEDNDNKLVLYGRNSSRRATLDLVIGDPVYRELPVEAVLDGDWHHLCVVWSSIQGRFWHYSDRRLTSTGSRFQKDYEIPAGGTVVLGQEQDSVGGGFDEAEAFVGWMAGFAAWDRALSPGEVSEVATGRGLPRGAVLTLDDIRQPNGDVRLVHCDCLDQCV